MRDSLLLSFLIFISFFAKTQEDLSVFEKMGKYAEKYNVSLIGIMNYEASKIDGISVNDGGLEREFFYIQYQHGHDIISEQSGLNNLKLHKKNIADAKRYLERDGVERYNITTKKIYQDRTITNWRGKHKTKKEYVGTEIRCIR